MTQGKLFNFFIHLSRTGENVGTHAIENEWDRGEAKAICKNKRREGKTKHIVTFMQESDRGEAKASCQYKKRGGNTKHTTTCMQPSIAIPQPPVATPN